MSRGPGAEPDAGLGGAHVAGEEAGGVRTAQGADRGRMPPVVATRQQVARDHLAAAVRDPESLLVTALRTKSIYAREILAEAAWAGSSTDDIVAWSRSGTDAPVELDVAAAARLAQALALQTGSAEDTYAARAVLEALVADRNGDQVPPRAVDLLAQVRLVGGDTDAARQLLTDRRVRPAIAAAVEADALNPYRHPRTEAATDGEALAHSTADEQRWLDQLNRALIDEGTPVAPLRLRDLHHLRGQQPFDRLTADLADAEPVPEEMVSAHPVTVIMSAYRPGPEMLVALRSLLEQTWSNLEILVVHDASGAEYREILDQAQALDPRVRVIHKSINGGTYRARNTALRQASGEFTVVLDSDDWMHPQMIEWSVRALLNQPRLLAVRSQCVRTTEELQLTRPGYTHRMLSAASLTFRTTRVLNRIGFFDPTSKSADTEFARRIVAAFGDRIKNLPYVGVLLRSGDTLSSSEFSAGWRHTTRLAYKSAYGHWHRRIRSAAAPPFLDPEGPRVIAEPRRWAKPTARAFAPTPRIDVCFAGDWRRFGGPQRSMLEEIRAALDAGLRVAIMHLEAFRFMTRKDDPVCAAVLDLVQNGQVEWVHPDDDVDIALVLLRYPPIMQYPPARPAAGRQARVGQVLLMANQAPIEPDGSDQRYVVRDVTERATEFFGVAPKWIPQSPMIRRVLREQDPTVRLTEWDNPGLIDLEQWWVRDPERVPGRDGPVVIGRYSRDNPIKFPATYAEMLTGYRFDERFEVRMMGALHTVLKLAAAADVAHDDLPANWALTRHKTQEVAEFLADLDFFLYLDNADTREAFGRVLLEAAASGVLTIAHPKHRETFGDAVDYALPGQAQDLIEHYLADPDAYRRRVLESRRVVTERFGRAAFGGRLRAMTGGPRSTTGSAPRGDGDAVIRVDGVAADLAVTAQPGVRLERMPLRSGADAERSDLLWVAWEGETRDPIAGDGAPDVGQEPVHRWLRQSWEVAGPRDFDALLLRDPPAQAGALIWHRDGEVRVVAREGFTVDVVTGSASSWRPDLGEMPVGWTGSCYS